MPSTVQRHECDADENEVHLDSSYLCLSVEIGAIGRLLSYMNELTLAQPRKAMPLAQANAAGAPHAWQAGAPAVAGFAFAHVIGIFQAEGYLFKLYLLALNCHSYRFAIVIYS